MLAGDAGEFEAEMTQVKWQDGNVVIMAKAAALWSPLPMMGVWDMKLSIPREELPKVLKMMALFALKNAFKMMGAMFSCHKPRK